MVKPSEVKSADTTHMLEERLRDVQRRYPQSNEKEDLETYVVKLMEVLEDTIKEMREHRRLWMWRLHKMEENERSLPLIPCWYAIARGPWDPKNKVFISKVTEDEREYLALTRGVWRPISKICSTNEEAWDFVDLMRDPMRVDGFAMVYKGVFSSEWYRINDHNLQQCVLTHDEKLAQRLIKGCKHRDYAIYNNAVDPQDDQEYHWCYKMVDELDSPDDEEKVRTNN